MDITLPDDALTALKRVGITGEQIRLYALLISEGPKTAGDISTVLKKDRAAVYKHLEKLMKLGIVDKGLGNSNVYIARPVDTLRELVQGAIEEQYIIERKVMNDTITKLQNIAGANRVNSRSEYIMIFGRKRLYQELRRLFKETHSEYRLIMSGNGLLRSIRHGLLDDYIEMLRRGVKVMIVTEVNEQNRSEASLLYQYIQFKHQGGLQIRLNIFDQDRVLLGAIQHDDDFNINRRDDSYILIYDRNLAKGLIKLFDVIMIGSQDAGALL